MKAVKNGVQMLLSALRQDPYALKTLFLSIITFNSNAQQIAPLTELSSFQAPSLKASGQTALGEALKLLYEKVDTEVAKTTPEKKGDWKPLVFIMTDGKPSDLQLYNEMAEKIKKRGFATIVPCAAGMKAQTEPLKKLSDNVYSLQNMDEGDFRKFFQWVSASITVGNQSMGASEDLRLPPPPDEVVVLC